MKCLILIFSLCFVSVFGTITPEQYIAMYKNDAIKEMNEYGVPASITLAQGMLESNNGNSTLAIKANNHFGIKCHNDWNGDTYHMDDDAKNECFRKYSSVLESFRDHSKFLKERSRYTFLFSLEITDYKAWAKGLKEAGYATNPQYPQLLINLIERYQLNLYDSDVTLVDSTKHVVYISKNHVKFVKAKNEDTFEKLAKEFGVSAKRLKKYNDATDTITLKEGDVVFLQPKRAKGTQKEYDVKKGDTYRSISQEYAIKLKDLYKKNNISADSSPKEGERLNLRKKKK